MKNAESYFKKQVRQPSQVVLWEQVVGGPLPTTTHDNTANGLTSIFSWLFSDGDNDKEQEPPQDEKGAKK